MMSKDELRAAIKKVAKTPAKRLEVLLGLVKISKELVQEELENLGETMRKECETE